MSITIPDELLTKAKLTEADALKELILTLFAQHRLTTGQACRALAMDRISFQHLLAERKIPMHYDVKEFEQDMQTLRELGLL